MQFDFIGCKIRISFLFILFVTAVILIDKTGAMIWGVAAAILHEMSHIIVMVLKGSKPKEVVCNFFEISIVDSKRSIVSSKTDALILLAGPLSNFFMCFLFYVVYKITNEQFLLIPLVENLVMGLLNLLPIQSLDGGQILYILLSSKIDITKVNTITQVISIAFLIPISILGFYVLLKSRYNFSLLLISCYLVFAVINKNEKIY